MLASLILYSPATMPVDAAIAWSDHNATHRPGILSGRADLEEGLSHDD